MQFIRKEVQQKYLSSIKVLDTHMIQMLENSNQEAGRHNRYLPNTVIKYIQGRLIDNLGFNKKDAEKIVTKIFKDQLQKQLPELKLTNTWGVFEIKPTKSQKKAEQARKSLESQQHASRANSNSSTLVHRGSVHSSRGSRSL